MPPHSALRYTQVNNNIISEDAMTNILQMEKAELLALQQKLQSEYASCKAAGLKLDMSRGKPGADQLALSNGLISAITDSSQLIDGGVDTRNYGGLDGIAACRALFADLLEVPVEYVVAGGNSSLTMMYDTVMRLWVFGAPGHAPLSKQENVKWLCPVPGYDRHFAITGQLGIEMIPVPMLENGPDMDMVEALVAKDKSIKGIWCVPKYSNPEGKSYSDDVVRRFAALKTAAEDFRIIWDNAYFIHDIYEDSDALLNIIPECEKNGTLDRVLMFASTSKITFPGAGVGAMVASPGNIKWFKDIATVQMIGPDKINQLRHVMFFGNAQGVREHMKKHADILRPKFDMVLRLLTDKIQGTGAGTFHRPRGGYFISFDSMPGCAKKIHKLCSDAGVTLTTAGATFPNGKDEKDQNIRIAPTLPPAAELEKAMEVFCVAALLSAVEKRLSDM